MAFLENHLKILHSYINYEINKINMLMFLYLSLKIRFEKVSKQIIINVFLPVPGQLIEDWYMKTYLKCQGQ